MSHERKKMISKIIATLKTGCDNTIDWETFADQNSIKELSEVEYRGEYLLHIACRYKAFNLAKVLILAGADVNKTSNARNMSPLQIAFKKDDLRTATLLYQNGASLFYTRFPYGYNSADGWYHVSCSTRSTKWHDKKSVGYSVHYYAQTKRAKLLFSLLQAQENGYDIKCVNI